MRHGHAHEARARALAADYTAWVARAGGAKDRRLRGGLLLAAVAVAGGLVWWAARQLWRWQGPGTFQRARYEAVVERARALGLAPGETRELRLDDPADPRTLRPRRPGDPSERGRGAGNVWAMRTRAGALRVVIETRDLGHAGEYGFAYSDDPLVPRPAEGGWSTLEVPGHLEFVLPSMRIDASWWEVAFNLD